MIVGIGVDIVEVGRIRKALERSGSRFMEKMFTEGEREYCLAKANSAESFAARFAAKEAAMKALGTGWQKGVGFLSVEVRRNDFDAPELLLHGEAAKHAKKLGADKFFVSLSHTENYAIAQVILEGVLNYQAVLR